VLSQASNITGIRSRSEASMPAAAWREPFVWRARPLVLRCCAFITCSWFAGAFCMASSTAIPSLLYSVPFPAIPLPVVPFSVVSFPAVPFPVHHMPRPPFSQFCAFPAAQSIPLRTTKQNKEQQSSWRPSLLFLLRALTSDFGRPYSTDPSHLPVRHQATPAITHQSALNSNIAEWPPAQ
jgi:hypothetical protein